eukprot:NODE_83_length_22684_cov_0.307934.p16 type:complete len:121 gc:universal NODE_83_length_22684_cov_0.307934:6340-5978(-)
MEMGFLPIKAQVYLQDLTQSNADLYGTYKSTMDPYVAGGNRLKYIWAHTHMDENKLVRKDIEAYIELVKSYNYKVLPLSECLGVPPYMNSFVQPENKGNGKNSAGLLSAILLCLCVLNLL